MRLKVSSSKPLLLIFPFNLLSHYLRCLMLAKYLASYFEIRFAYSQPYSGFISEEGFETFECLSLDAKKVMEAVKMFDFSWVNDEELENIFNSQLGIIKQLKPIVVLGDTSPSLKMAAEKAGVHFIALMNGYMSKYYAFSRPLSRTHPVYPILKLFPKIILDALTKKGEAITMTKVHSPFKSIRQKYKLSEKRSYLDELEGDVNLLCDLDELFPQRNLPASYQFISPLFYDPPKQLTGLSEKLDKTKKTIFVSMGSTGNWEKLIFLNDEYFTRYNLVTAGDTGYILSGSHIIRTGFGNFHELFPYTDLVICHGGNGTIYQSLFYGIPVLCKTSHFEQEWNVAALERMGVGKSLDGIKNISAHITLIEKWIDKKNTSLYTMYDKRMSEERKKLDNIIKEIAVNILTAGVAK